MILQACQTGFCRVSRLSAFFPKLLDNKLWVSVKPSDLSRLGGIETAYTGTTPHDMKKG
jgi:hypothetical protein